MFGFERHRFNNMPIIGILRGVSQEDIVNILPLYLRAGLSTLEITLNSSEALTSIRFAVNEYGRDINIGAGTVCNTDDLERALSAGATFIVTPIVDSQVIKRCKQWDIPIFPGAMTPTEILRAWSLGATMVKLFPATACGGPGYVTAIKCPLGQVKLLATGNIQLSNMENYWQVGVNGFGIGSPLFPRQLLEKKAWNTLADHFKVYASTMAALMKT